MTPLFTFLAGLFVGGVAVVVVIVATVAFGRSLGSSMGRRVGSLVKVDAKAVDVERLRGTKPRPAPVEESIATPDSDTAIVRAALKQLQFNKAEIDFAVGQVRGRAMPVPEKIRLALSSLARAKQNRVVGN